MLSVAAGGRAGQVKTVTEVLTIEEPDQFAWDGESDVVVVGLGGAGVCAALEALEAGLSVTSLDRFEGGGATRASGGVVYLGGGTQTQVQAGVEDDPDNMLAYLCQEVGDIVPKETLADFCRQSPANEDWLRRHGVRFEPVLWPGKTSYPNAEYFLYHSDNSLIAPYSQAARPAARGHRGWVEPEKGRKAINLGGAIFDPLRTSARALGLREIRLAEVCQLVCDGQGRVIGVRACLFPEGSQEADAYRHARARAEKWMSFYPPILPGAGFFFRRGLKWSARAARMCEGRPEIILRARRGVVISAGGFAFNRAMMRVHAPKFAAGYPLGTEGDDGGGIMLGQSAGGAVGNMGRVTAWRFINPPYGFAQGIIVNGKGERFINEMKYGAHIGVEIGEHQDGRAWLVLDARLARAALRQVSGGRALPFQRDLARLNLWLAARRGSLSAIASRCGIDAAGLVHTVREYNAFARGSGTDRFGKSADDCAVLEGPDYLCIDIGIAARLFPCPTLTLGGLQVDHETGAVRSVDGGGMVKGLYAAGRSAVGVCSHNYVSGLSIADCIYSGRRAGRSLSASNPA